MITSRVGSTTRRSPHVSSNITTRSTQPGRRIRSAADGGRDSLPLPPETPASPITTGLDQPADGDQIWHARFTSIRTHTTRTAGFLQDSRSEEHTSELQ